MYHVRSLNGLGTGSLQLSQLSNPTFGVHSDIEEHGEDKHIFLGRATYL